MAFLILGCFAVFLFGCWMFLRPKKKCILPPGPKGIPVFGSALDLDIKQFSFSVYDIGKKYGDAYTIKLFNENFVFLQSSDIIKETMGSAKYAKIFSGRPKTFLGEYILKNDEVFQTYSKEWSSLRKLVFRGLKNYGSNMAEVEELVREELEHMILRIQNEADKLVDPYDITTGYVISILVMLLTGQHLKHDDPLLRLCSHISEDFDYIASPGVSTLMTKLPWLRHIPLGCGKVHQRLLRNISLMQKSVYETRKNNQKKKICFLDFLQEEKDNGNITDESMTSIFNDILIAGIVTTRSNTYSVLLVMATRQDIQRKVQEEIDHVIGRSRLPCIEDKHRMPYTQAVLLEELRFYTGIFSLPHCTMEDVEFRDYVLPKDTVVFYSMWGAHHDKDFWKNPFTFDPTRFLDDDGNLVPPEHETRQRMLPFGLGKRSCVGETLARLRIFMALATILQKFTLLPDPEHPLPDIDPRKFESLLLLTAPRYKIIFRPREEK